MAHKLLPKEVLRRALVAVTVLRCENQHRESLYHGWPCCTCLRAAFEKMGLSSERAQQVWEAVLLIRGDYHEENGEVVPGAPEQV